MLNDIKNTKKPEKCGKDAVKGKESFENGKTVETLTPPPVPRPQPTLKVNKIQNTDAPKKEKEHVNAKEATKSKKEKKEVKESVAQVVEESSRENSTAANPVPKDPR